MPKKTTLCENCPIAGVTHHVPAVQKIAHALEIRLAHELAQSSEAQSSNNTGLAGSMSALSIAQRPPHVSVAPSGVDTPLVPSEHSGNDTSLTDLADWMTMLVMTDAGPDSYQQPSKLFTPREEFQEMRAPELPDAFHPIPLSEASRSIQTLLAHQMPEDVQASLQSLDVSFDKGKPEEVAAMRICLDAAANVVTAAGESLKNLASNYHLKELRGSVVADVQVLDQHIDVMSARLPRVPGTPDAGPMRYSAVHLFLNPIADLDLIAEMTLLLVVICNVIIGIGSNPCNFILETLRAIIVLVMSLNVNPGAENDANQLFVLQQLPPNLHAALQAFKIDSKTTVYAVCPSCSFTHAPMEDKATGALTYPATCQNTIIGKDGPSNCDEDLLDAQHSKMRPLKTYVFASFEEYLARLLADPKIEEMCDRTCDVAMASLAKTPESVTNVFHVSFMRSFEGPEKGKLFIDRGDRMRLAFEVQLDFFNPNGTRKRGNHDSIGILSAALMNLDDDIQYKPDALYVSIIPGMNEPDVEEIPHYVWPLIDVFAVGWERGLHFSPTGRSSTGRDVDLAIIISVNDLPATRKSPVRQVLAHISFVRSVIVII
ncbi:hypothetical protein C8R44DRAFT_866290 [Mycena epipterygia]|nr:hypothetical protein C8R44DRAFT_866290 [Mycena epipterygia]